MNQGWSEPSVSYPRRWLAHALLAATIVGCIALILWPPEQSSWYPVCPFWNYLHLLCPGCGATRALAALLRGHLAKALHWNALFVLLLPFGLAAAGECYRRALSPREFHWPRISPALLYSALALAAAFTLARNTSFIGF